MSVTYGFYNSIDHDRRYDAMQMSAIFDGIINDGVFMSIGNHMAVKEYEGMLITVGSGRAWFDHTWTLNSSDLIMEVPQSEIMLNRIDTVIIEVDAREESRKNTIKIIKGTPADRPVRPTLINEELIHQHPLADIYVTSETETISQSNITNRVGTGDCPFVTGILETINIDDLIAQWSAEWRDWKITRTDEFDTWSLNQRREYEEWITYHQDDFTRWLADHRHDFEAWSEEQQRAFVNWVDTIRDILDETAAGHLQLEIEDLQDRVSDIELTKFPNATIIGSPIINQGQISGFSDNDYLRFPFVVDFKGRTFEIKFDFTTGPNVTTQENLFDSDFGLAFAIRYGRFVIAMSSDGVSWDMGEHVGSVNVLPNTSYKIRMAYDNYDYKISYSTDGGDSYIRDITVTSSKKLYPRQIYIGVGINHGTVLNHFSGIVNFNYCTLIISDKLIWQGMDDVGIATRLAVDMSNIDAAGIVKLRDLASLRFDNIRVYPSYFVKDDIYPDYPYKGTIPLIGVQDNQIITVIFDMNEAISGDFAPVAKTGNNEFYIYSEFLPDEFVIPSIICTYV